MKKQNHPDLSVLKKADAETLEKISETCPVLNQKEQNRLFQRSQAKYRIRRLDTEEFAETETFEAEPITRTFSFVNIGAAAACFLVCAGTVGGGVWLMKHPQKPNVSQSAEQLTSEANTETSVTEASAPETSVTAKVKETRPAEQTTVSAETLAVLQSQTITVPAQTDTPKSVPKQTAAVEISTETTRNTATFSTTAEPEQTATQPPETSAKITTASTAGTTISTTVITEPEYVPETPTENALFQKLNFDENGCIHFEGMTVKTHFYTSSKKEYSISAEDAENPKYMLDKIYVPSYFPESNAQFMDENTLSHMITAQENDSSVMKSAEIGGYAAKLNSFILNYKTPYDMAQFIQQTIYTDWCDSQKNYLKTTCNEFYYGNMENYYAYQMNGKKAILCGYADTECDRAWYVLTWVQDGYLFRLGGTATTGGCEDFVTVLANSEDFQDTVRMAESVAPNQLEGKIPDDFPIEHPDPLDQKSEIFINNVQYIREDMLNAFEHKFKIIYSETKSTSQTVVITSPEELEGLVSELIPAETAEKYPQYTAPIYQKFSIYDDAFFAEHDLLVVLKAEGSGSFWHEVQGISVDSENNCTVMIDRHIPEECTEDMAYWAICIETEKQIEQMNSVSVKFNDIMHSYNW